MSDVRVADFDLPVFSFALDGVQTAAVETERDGLVLKGTLQAPVGVPDQQVPLVLLLHGARGNRRSDFYDGVCQALAHRGYAMMRFDFNGHGDSDGEFDDSTVVNELEDLAAIVSYARSLPWAASVSAFGHSQGGCVAAMFAGQNPDAFDAIVTVDAATNIRDNCASGALDGKASAAYVAAGRELDIFGTAGAYEGPACIIHGLDDTMVLPSYSLQLHEALPQANVHLLAGAGHTPVSHVQEVVAITDLFLRRSLTQ